MRIPQMLSKEEFDLFNALLGAFVQPANRTLLLYKEAKDGVLLKPRVYLLCDKADEGRGYCPGRVVAEDGTLLGFHTSTTLDWLRLDLKSQVDTPSVEIIDLIGQEVPERFRV